MVISYSASNNNTNQNKYENKAYRYLIKFLDRIRGALTAAPTKEEPVNHIPHAAPITDNPKPNATPKLANPYGLMWVKTSDHPALQYSELHTFVVDDMIN